MASCLFCGLSAPLCKCYGSKAKFVSGDVEPAVAATISGGAMLPADPDPGRQETGVPWSDEFIVEERQAQQCHLAAQRAGEAKARTKANARQEGGAHYQGEYTQQHWDYAWERGFDQFQYCITKYVERHKKKNGLEDLRKAKHYLEKYIEIMEAEQCELK